MVSESAQESQTLVGAGLGVHCQGFVRGDINYTMFQWEECRKTPGQAFWMPHRKKKNNICWCTDWDKNIMKSHYCHKHTVTVLALAQRSHLHSPKAALTAPLHPSWSGHVHTPLLTFCVISTSHFTSFYCVSDTCLVIGFNYWIYKGFRWLQALLKDCKWTVSQLSTHQPLDSNPSRCRC